MPRFLFNVTPQQKNATWVEVKYYAHAGYVLEVQRVDGKPIEDLESVTAAAYEHMRDTYPAEPWVMKMADRCAHSDNAQREAL